MDAYVGGLAETHDTNSTIGELFKASIAEQFSRIRNGDRYYFENRDNELFSDAEISTIKETSGLDFSKVR